MNKKQLLKLGVPEDCVPAAIEAVSNAGRRSDLKSKDAMRALPEVLKSPAAYTDDSVFGELARALIVEQQFAPRGPIPYRTWGPEGIDEQSHAQMRNACSLPNALPFIFNGFRLGITGSVIGAVVGEFVSANSGLGYIVVRSTSGFDIPMAMAAVVVPATISVTLYQLVSAVQVRLTPWAPKLDR